MGFLFFKVRCAQVMMPIGLYLLWTLALRGLEICLFGFAEHG